VATAALFIAERAGKAIRGPARDVMISHAAAAVGRGKGFAVHEALDQAGGVAGPLLVAAVLAATATTTGTFLAWLYRRGGCSRCGYAPASDPHDSTALGPARHPPTGRRLLPRLLTYLAFTVLTTASHATFGVLSFHLATRRVGHRWWSRSWPPR
jgi:hypothetical protein